LETHRLDGSSGKPDGKMANIGIDKSPIEATHIFSNAIGLHSTCCLASKFVCM